MIELSSLLILLLSIAPLGEFIREILLPACIPDDARLEAYGDETVTGLEIMVPKHHVGPEEHEVRVCLRPHLEVNELLLSWMRSYMLKNCNIKFKISLYQRKNSSIYEVKLHFFFIIATVHNCSGTCMLE